LSRGALIAAIVVIVVIAAAAAIIATRGGKTATPTPTATPTATASPTVSPTATASPSPTTTTAATATAAKKRDWICVVYDIGGRGDLSFNDMAYLGASRAAKDFGLKLKEVQSTSEADYLPNLRALAQSKRCAIIIAVGFLMTDAVKQVSKEYPDQLFAIIDGYVPNRSNVLSVLFKEHEGSAVVGALAGMVAHLL
jgi:basic membrane protein A